MPARWLFVVVFLAYLFGPSRAPSGEAPGAGAALAAAAASPVAAVLGIVYPSVPVADRERWTGRIVCAFSVAAAVALTFAAARRLAAAEGALLLAASAAFASPLWSWTSRADAAGALTCLALAALLWLAVAWPRGRPWLLASIVGGAVLLAADGFRRFDAGVFAAYLVSPGRGLLLFAPLALLAGAALVRGDGPRPLAAGCALALLALLAGVASREKPWGEQGFGPTLLAPFVPLLAVMAAGLPRRWLRVGAMLSLPAAIAHGASVFLAGHTWDERRGAVLEPEAFWDWQDSPFSDLAFGPPRPDLRELPVSTYFLQEGDHATRQGRPTQWLAYGWEKPEPTGVWAAGDESWIVLATPPGDYVLTLVASAPSRRGRPQQLSVERPGAPELSLEFTKELWDLERLAVPFRAERRPTLLKLRPAHTRIMGKGDARRLAFFLAELRLQRAAGERR